MIFFKEKGNLRKTNDFLNKVREKLKISNLDYYCIDGVNALKQNTPIDTGLTSESWYYKIDRSNNYISIKFNNSNINQGVSIALILQYGHGTKNGGWVEGRDYINPAMKPIFDKIEEEAWKEVIG